MYVRVFMTAETELDGKGNLKLYFIVRFSKPEKYYNTFIKK